MRPVILLLIVKNQVAFVALIQSLGSDLFPLLLTVIAWGGVMALGVLSVLCWRKFKNLSFMEQFLDYRQVPTATEANENTESIKENGHVEKVKEPNGKRIQQKGVLLILFTYY